MPDISEKKRKQRKAHAKERRKNMMPDTLPGLTKGRNKSGHYEICYMHRNDDGSERLRRISTYEHQKSVAVKRFAAWLAALDGSDVVGGHNRVFTLRETLQAYRKTRLKELRSLRREVFAIEYGIQHLLNFYDGNTPIRQMCQPKIDQYIDARRNGIVNGKRVRDTTIARELRVLRAAINHCVKYGLLAPNEAPQFTVPESHSPRDRVLSKKELNTLFEAAYALQENGVGRLGQLYRYVTLLYFTMSRAAAIKALTWEQVDFENKVIHLNPAGRVQTRKRRPSVPMSDKLMPILQQAFSERVSIYVLDMKHQSIDVKLTRFCKSLGLAGVTSHTLRHTAATIAAQNGADMLAIAAMMGDSPLTVRRHYIHHDTEFIRNNTANAL